MLDALITSKTRIKLLLKFFLNSKTVAYLRGLETEFGESTNSIRLELNKFEKAGLLTTQVSGNRKYFKANTDHPLYNEIHNILIKHVGFDQIIDKVINKIGDIQTVFVVGDFAKGMDSPIIDLVFVGDGLNKEYLLRFTEKVEKVIKRKIRYIVIRDDETSQILDKYKEGILTLWKS